MWMQGKLVGCLDVPGSTVIISKGGRVRLGSASLPFPARLWKVPPVLGFSQQQCP